jgi:protein involved in ribonucleotide reduction
VKSTKEHLTCYISAGISTDLHPLNRILKSIGIATIRIDHPEFESELISTTVQKLIQKADLVIGVLSEGSNNNNVFFELGFARALRRPIFLIVPPNLELPFGLKDIISIRSDSKNEEAIKFALEQIKVRSKHLVPKSKVIEKKTHAIGNKAIEFLEAFQNNNRHFSESQIEEVIASALKDAGVTAIASSSNRDYGADLAVWIDELENLMGNPILFEIKGRINSQSHLDETISRCQKYAKNAKSKYIVLLYLESNFIEATSRSLIPPNIMVFQITDLISRLQKNSLGKILMHERNRLVHGSIS